MKEYTITLPLRLVSALNVREHWRTRARRAKLHRNACIAIPKLRTPATVLMTRLGPRTLDDDNLQGACKHVRDGIADRLGVDDGDGSVSWLYAQERSKEYGVRIHITERTA